MQLALLHTEREAEVYQLEHFVLSRPENVVRLQVRVHEAIGVEADQRGQEVPSELEDQPRGEAVSVVLVDDLSDIVLKQLQDKERVSLELDGVVEGDDVGPGPGVPLQDEPLPLHGALVARTAAETLESHETSVSYSHGLVDETAPANTNLKRFK